MASLFPLPISQDDPKALFGLDWSYTFLNHGSFGACPNEVLAAQDRSRREFEARPIELLGRKVEALLSPSREIVARFVGTDPSRLGFMVNATEGVNAVLQCIEWKLGDEVLALDMLYNAVRKSVQRMHATHGITSRVREEIALINNSASASPDHASAGVSTSRSVLP